MLWGNPIPSIVLHGHCTHSVYRHTGKTPLYIKFKGQKRKKNRKKGRKERREGEEGKKGGKEEETQIIWKNKPDKVS